MRVRTRIICTISASVALTGLAAAPALASTHVVQTGDTLSGIAAANGMSLSSVEAANPAITNPNFITVGELVDLPDGSSSSYSSDEGASTSSSSYSTPSTSTSDTSSSYSSSSTPSSFQSCVAWRESSDTATDPDGLYGMLPSTWQSLGYSGTAGEASVAEQNAAFQKLYAEDGTSPWAAYDGC